ncbi:hypothetical protein JR064_19095 [Xanthomonas sp. CFBP 8703]|uniref:Secreted protein n=1 Tax=Xanthomonas bonasiae TaxID=2810351 RepID=A0ABS3BBH0_9XANT|nr:hypothetical protein [Xanthomonas bonasiae]MBN6104274.1 hypothetical protein [Xanthomonas bonasiae]
MRGLLLGHFHLLQADLLHLDLLDLHQSLLRRLLGRFLSIHTGTEERPLVAKRRVDRQHLRVRDGELVISAVYKA